MIEQKKQWLMGVTWDSIVNINRTLCQAQKLEPQNNQRTYATTERAWEQAAAKSTSLLEAFDACRRAFDQSPFIFNNGNTFAAVARSVIEDCLRAAPAVEGQIVRSTIGHYVAGTIGRKELAQVLTQFAPMLSRAQGSLRSVAESPAPQLAAQPVASA